MQQTDKFSTLKSPQRGVALAISLIFLVVLTMLGVAALQTTMLEEKMAGNTKNLNIAFQAAEAGLRAGEDYARNQNISQFYDNCTNGFCSHATGDETPRWKDSALNIWNTAGKHQTDSGFTGDSADPQFIIQELPASIDQSGGSLVRGFKPASDGNYFTVTARGVDATGTASVYLQSILRK